MANAESLSFGDSYKGLGQQIVPFPTNTASLNVCLLHGNLDIWVREAKNLPNMDMPHKRLADNFSKLYVKHKRSRDILSKLPGKIGSKIEEHMSKTITSDPYVIVSVSGAVIGRTFVIGNSENPVWMQHFNVPVAHSAAEVHFVVKDNDVVGSQIIGAVGIAVEKLCSEKKIEGTFPILSDSGMPCKAGAVLSLSIQYTAVGEVNLYNGVGDQGVPGTYFPLRRGGKVTLYQDAHAHDIDGCLIPNLKLDGDVQYVHRDCWRDIFEAINQARHLVYIAGWSLDHMVRLIRDGNIIQLGDLLKTKSREGVRILLLVWDDPSSVSILGYKREGFMKTKDEETRHFFKHSSVKVLLCPRSAGKGHSFVKKQVGYG